jgi:CheY-like chemotaxis protein
MERAPVRVVVVDDSEDVRLLLSISLRTHGSYDVVGEAADGRQAVEVAKATRPELIILDREMPIAGGIEVLPELRAELPDTTIILFTASADDRVREAAMAAGADDIREKLQQPIGDLLDELSGMIVAAASPGARGRQIHLRLGPIDSQVASIWVASTLGLLDALREHPEEVTDGVDGGLLEVFAGFLLEWRSVADAGGDFLWSATASADTVERLVAAWAKLDQLSDETMARLGRSWSPPEARPFFDALATAVVSALEPVEELGELVASLPADWRS